MLQPGEQISRYTIISSIGAGGMGEVYLATDTDLERQVALKVLLDEIAGNDDRVLRFIQEAKAASALNHPNILTVFDIGIHENTRFIATEFIKGKTLRDRLRGDPMTIFEALEISLQVAAALNAAHGAGIIHRDIKPENIMIRDDGLVKVLDFGLAKLTEKQVETASPEDETLAQIKTHPGIVMGTVAYMSPEQARGRKLDVRTDIFSLGIVMFELFTGKRPFLGEGNVDLISSILKDEPELLRQISPNLPRHLERIVEKSLRKDRELRFQSVKDLHIDLVDLRDELKFEEKLGKSAGATTAIAAHLTDADPDKSTNSDNRSISSIPYIPSSITVTRRFTLLHFFLFAVAAIGIAGSAWWFGFRNVNNAPPGSYKVSEVANWISAPGELFSNGSFAPNGNMIAFASTKSNAKNIWVTQTASTDAIQVTNDSFSNRDPIWSPKGDEIAYFSDKGNSSNATATANGTGVWRVGALGGTPKSIGSIADGSAELRKWTASGKIYYQVSPDLFAMDIASGVSTKITSFGDQNEKIRWVDISADEKRIAYVKQTDNDWQLFTAGINSTGPSVVVESKTNINKVVWLSDKNIFFYSSNLDGVMQIFKIAAGSSIPVRLTASDTDNDVIDASPDGSSVLFSSVKEESNLWRVDVATQQESPVSRNVNSELWPAGSPDSLKVVYQSIKNLSQGQHLFDGTILIKTMTSGLDSSQSAQLTSRGFLPSWSPDGSAIAFLRASSNSTPGLLVANPNGGGEKLLASEGLEQVGYAISPYNTAQTNAFAWSPDSSKIAYVAVRNGISNIWAVSPADGKETQISENVDPDKSIKCPLWSSDGKRIAFYIQSKKRDQGKFNFGLGIVNIDARQSISVLQTDRLFRLIGWTFDEKGLIIAEIEKMGNLSPQLSLDSIAIDSSVETRIASLENVYFYNIFLSADRRNIAFVARNDDKDDIWMVPSSGGAAKKLTNNNDAGLSFSRLNWLRDGSSILFGKQTRFSLLSRMIDIN